MHAHHSGCIFYLYLLLNDSLLIFQSSCDSSRALHSPAALPLNNVVDDIELPPIMQLKKKKKDKKNKKDKERKHQQRSITPLSPNGSNVSGTPRSNESSKNGDEQALSESELESKRAALLAQLNEQMEME